MPFHNFFFFFTLVHSLILITINAATGDQRFAAAAKHYGIIHFRFVARSRRTTMAVIEACAGVEPDQFEPPTSAAG